MNSDDVDVRYSRRNYSYKCEDCGYKWDVSIEEEEVDAEENTISSEELFEEIEVSECPMCGNSNIIEV
ncbi:MAG: hypothetical protein QMD92_06525 [bacterium]|nr:hypothetical protein [bacterium]